MSEAQLVVKAELIQASVNTYSGSSVFTFRLQYPRASWLRRFKVFDRWLEKQTIMTGRGLSSFERTLLEDVADGASYGALIASLDEQIYFANHIFKAVRGNGKITGNDIQKAIELFGPRFQQVLKQYEPGQRHDPLNVVEHAAEATRLGWELLDRG